MHEDEELKRDFLKAIKTSVFESLFYRQDS
jgi:hypothetical protein